MTDVNVMINNPEDEINRITLIPPKKRWPDPTPEMLKDPKFEAIWQCIKKWDIGLPWEPGLYSGATGNHVRAILDALESVK